MLLFLLNKKNAQQYSTEIFLKQAFILYYENYSKYLLSMTDIVIFIIR